MNETDQTVRGYLLNAIETGTYPAGARLPTERALSETLSVGRSAVRNALSVLEGEGRIIRVAGSGTFVAESARGDAPLGQVTSPIQVMDARIAFEPTLIRLVVTNGTAAHFAHMERCLIQGAAAETIDQFEHWDAAFHEAIAVATGNPVMIAPEPARSRCTSSRAAGPVIHWLSPLVIAVAPSRLAATLARTNGRPRVTRLMKPSFRARAAASIRPTSVATPADLSLSSPRPATLSNGSCMAATTRCTLDAINASAHGGVLP